MSEEQVKGFTVRMLGPDDAALLAHADPDVFDTAAQPELIQQFLDDPRHHIAVAIDERGIVRGFASGIDIIHPDKQPQLFVMEVGVADAYQQRGLGKQVLEALLAHARTLGCNEAWVVTERDNVAACGLYEKLRGAANREALVMYTFDLLEKQ